MSVFHIQGLSEEIDLEGDQSEQPEINKKAGQRKVEEVKGGMVNYGRSCQGNNSSGPELEVAMKSGSYYITYFLGQGRQWRSHDKTKLLLVEK